MASTNNQNKHAPQNEKGVTMSWLIFFILFLIILGFVIYYFSEIKREVKLLDKENTVWLFAAIFAQFLTYYFTAFIYQFLLAAQKMQQTIRLWDLLQASIISLFFNQTVPSAGVSGNTFIFNFLIKFNIRIAQIITIILAELLIFYTAMEVVIIFLLIIYISFYQTLHLFTVTLLSGFIVFLVFGAFVLLASKKRVIKMLYEKVKKIKFARRLFEKLNHKEGQQALVKEDVQLIAFLKRKKKTVLKTLLLQIVVIVADGLTIYTLFKGLGFSVSPLVVLLSLICTKIISILPFLPGALLLYESGMSFFFASLGVPLSMAIIVTLLFRLLSFWLPIPIGLLLYRKWLKKEPAVNNQPLLH